MTESLDLILAKHGVSPADVQRSLGITGEAFRQYRRGNRQLRAAYVLEIEAKFGVKRSLLRPDLWPLDERYVHEIVDKYGVDPHVLRPDIWPTPTQ